MQVQVFPTTNKQKLNNNLKNLLKIKLCKLTTSAEIIVKTNETITKMVAIALVGANIF